MVSNLSTVVLIWYILSLSVSDYDPRTIICSHEPLIDPNYKFLCLILVIFGLSAHYIAHFKISERPIIREALIGGLSVGFLVHLFFLIQVLLIKPSEYNRDSGIFFLVPSSFILLTIFSYLIELIRWNRAHSPIKTINVLMLGPTTIGILGFVLHQKFGAFINSLQKTHGFGFSNIPSCQTPAPCYLCTIATLGHESIVHPIGTEKRGSEVINVTAQLIVARKFEQLFKEKFPRLHVVIRFAYDLFSKCIYEFSLKHRSNTLLPYIADFLFIMLKPIEFIMYTILLIYDDRE